MPTDQRAARPKRRYESPMRAERVQATRRAVREAAADLFATRGWRGTAMRDVAGAAGVAVETVYSHFSSKRVLLQAVIDVAVVGDERAVAVAQRDEFAAIGLGPRRDRLGAAASILRAVHERTAPYARALREAAPGDDQIAEMLQATRSRQRRDVEAALGLIVGRAPTSVETDEVWALASPEVYLLLVEEAGWTPAAYERWVVSTLERVVPRS